MKLAAGDWRGARPGAGRAIERLAQALDFGLTKTADFGQPFHQLQAQERGLQLL
jgi:hypothetical protein